MRSTAHATCSANVVPQDMLVCDMLGLVEITPWALAEPVGKAAARLFASMPSEIKKERKRALRRRLDVATVDAAVRQRPIRLPVPSAAECEGVRRAAARANEALL